MVCQPHARWQLRRTSSSINSLFLRASSFMCAFCSNLRISSRFVSRDICTRNISRFFAMKSAMFSFSRRRSWDMAAVAAATRPRVCLAWRDTLFPSRSPSMSAMRRVLPMRDDCVVFSHTFMRCSFSRCCQTAEYIVRSLRWRPPHGKLETHLSLGATLCLPHLKHLLVIRRQEWVRGAIYVDRTAPTAATRATRARGAAKTLRSNTQSNTP